MLLHSELTNVVQIICNMLLGNVKEKNFRNKENTDPGIIVSILLIDWGLKQCGVIFWYFLPPGPFFSSHFFFFFSPLPPLWGINPPSTINYLWRGLSAKKQLFNFSAARRRNCFFCRFCRQTWHGGRSYRAKQFWRLCRQISEQLLRVPNSRQILVSETKLLMVVMVIMVDTMDMTDKMDMQA